MKFSVTYADRRTGWSPMSSFDEKKAAVKRGAERELTLSMKPGSDIQIMGPFWDVHVEGKYLGWCSKPQRDELQKLYDETPSKLRHWIPKKIDLDGLQTSVELALGRCKRLELDILTANPAAVDYAVSDLRTRMELVYDTLLQLQEENRRRAVS